MSSMFFRDKEGIDRVQALVDIIGGLANDFSSVSEEKQQMYLQGMGLWAQDLQDAIGELGSGSTATDTTTTK